MDRSLWLGLLLLPVCAARPQTVSTSMMERTYSAVGILHVESSGISIPVRDLSVSCNIGNRLPLLQESSQFYITKVETVEYGERLCAFPKYDHLGEGTAWVSNQKLVVFGSPTRSVAGKFYLLMGERLPVLEDAESHYRVLVERYGQNVPLLISKRIEGTRYESFPKAQQFARSVEPMLPLHVTPPGEPPAKPAAPPAKKPKPSQRIVLAKGEQPEPLAPEAIEPLPPGPQPDETLRAFEVEWEARMAAATQAEPAVRSPTEPVALAKAEPEEPAAAPPAGTPAEKGPPRTTRIIALKGDQPPAQEYAPPAAETQVVAAVEPPSEDETATQEVAAAASPTESAEPGPVRGLFRLLIGNILLILVLFLAAALVALLLIRFRKQAPRPVEASQEVQTYTTLGESVASDYLQNLAHESGDFSGSLQGMALTELVQFLNSAQETGALVLKNDSDAMIGQLLFRKGEIFDAVFGEEHGPDAVQKVFKESGATFTFHRKPMTGKHRTIRQQTMGLILEISKQMDETAAGEGPHPETGRG